MDYRELFQRNYGIFSDTEQERLRRARVLIVGCGGIGATVALILARTGVERFVLVDFDVYSPTNMNRQIACFADTLGRKKAEVLGEAILGINPAAEVIAHDELLSHGRIAELMAGVDLVFPAADDLAFSVFVFRDAQRLGKPALMVNPAGGWAQVCLIPPGAPSIERIEGIPPLAGYGTLRETLAERRYKFASYHYVPQGDWRIDYYRGYIEEGWSPTQLCPIVWLASCLGAFEAVKLLTGKWKPLLSPRFYEVTAKGVRVGRLNGPSLHTLLVWQRKVMWRLFQTPLGPALAGMQDLWWRLFQRWYRWRERVGEKAAAWREGRVRQPEEDAGGAGEGGAAPETPGPDYETLFARNRGMLSESQQERLRRTRILIIGDTGSGETLATALARTGFMRFTLAGEGRYVPADMNRQIGCFTDTLGRQKTAVMAEMIRAINPAAAVTVHGRLPSPEELPGLIGGADIVIPAVDDLAYSVLVFRTSREMGKPAVLCLPAGALGWVGVFTPRSVTLEAALGIPPLDYRGLQGVIRSKEYRCAQYHYITQGDWRVDWFFDYFAGRRPLALICPAEWMLVSLAALETVKIATGKWPPLTAPRCWRLKNGRLHVSRFSWFTRLHRRTGWLIFGSPGGLRRHRWTHWIWKQIFAYFKARQKRDPSADGP